MKYPATRYRAKYNDCGCVTELERSIKNLPVECRKHGVVRNSVERVVLFRKGDYDAIRTDLGPKLTTMYRRKTALW